VKFYLILFSTERNELFLEHSPAKGARNFDNVFQISLFDISKNTFLELGEIPPATFFRKQGSLIFFFTRKRKTF